MSIRWDISENVALRSVSYKGGLKVMTTVRYFWHGFIHTGTTFMYLQYSLRPLIYNRLPNVWKASYTISASVFVDVPYWPPSSTDKFISCVVPGLSQWFLYFGEEIVIAWTHIGWVRWMFQNLPLPEAQEFRDNSGVAPCIVMKKNGVLFTKCRRVLLSPCDYDLFAKMKEPLRGIRDNTKDELIRAIGRSKRNINKDECANGVRHLPYIWQQMINKEGDYIEGII